MVTIKIRDDKFVDVPCFQIFMSGQKEDDYVTVFRKVNQLVWEHTGKQIDGQLTLVNGIQRACDINNTNRKLKRCTFHLNKNVRGMFIRCMEHEINPKHPEFNAEVYQYYIIMLKELYLPSNILIALNQYLLKYVKIQSFHYNRTENLRVQSELERCLISITKKYVVD